MCLTSAIVARKASCADAIPAKLSLKEAVGIALRSHASLKQSEKDYRNAVANLRVAGYKTSLDVGSSASLQRSQGESDTSGLLFGNLAYENLQGATGSLDVLPYSQGTDRGSVTMSLRQPLTARRGNLSAKSLDVFGARAAADIRERELVITRQATVLGVVRAYQRALLAREQIKVQERSAQIADEAAQITRKRADAKLVAEYEAAQAELNAAQTRNQLNNQRQAAKGAMEDLMVAMGRGIGQSPELTDPLPPDEVTVPDLVTALRTALDKRAELAVYDMQLLDQERQVAAARDDMRSRTDAILRFSSRDNDSGLMSRSVFDNGTMTAGVEHTFPLDKRVWQQKKDNAERDFEITKQLRLFEMERVAEEVRSAHRAVDSARLSLEIFSQNMKLADENVRRSQRMLDEDLGTTRDVLDAQGSLARVEGGRLSALVDLYLASINLKQAMGGDLATEMTK